MSQRLISPYLTFLVQGWVLWGLNFETIPKNGFKTPTLATNYQVELLLQNPVPLLYTEVRVISTCYLLFCHNWYVDFRVNWSIHQYYIDNNWELHSYCLTITYLSTGANTSGYTWWMEPWSFSIGSNNHWFWLEYKKGLFVTTVDENQLLWTQSRLSNTKITKRWLSAACTKTLLPNCVKVFSKLEKKQGSYRSTALTKVITRWKVIVKHNGDLLFKWSREFQSSNRCCAGQWY